MLKYFLLRNILYIVFLGGSKVENEETIKRLSKIFIQIKRIKLASFTDMENLTHNQKLVLYLLHENSVNGSVLLTEIREKLKLAPSTVTPIITSLEEAGYIKRNIDKNDRRNIYIEITTKGKEYTNMVHSQVTKNINEYMEFMGYKDTNDLIRLMEKTINYFENKERRKA